MYLKINRNKGESNEQYEFRKQKIKSMLDGLNVNYDVFTGPIDVIASEEAEIRLNHRLEDLGLKFASKELYDKALDDLTYEIGDSDMLDIDYISRMASWVLDREEFENYLIKIKEGEEWDTPYDSK